MDTAADRIVSALGKLIFQWDRKMVSKESVRESGVIWGEIKPDEEDPEGRD